MTQPSQQRAANGPSAAISPPPTSTTLKMLVYLAIIMAVGAIYWQVNGHAFLNFDDNGYVTENPRVLQGLSTDNILWSFATDSNNFYEDFYWQPLTWLSHMLDVHLFGLNSGRHHLVNVFFHLLNSLLIFTLLFKMTGRLWQSAFVALLFATHPVNVESVAWLAARKNVLSTFFWLLTMLTYVRFATNQTRANYLATFLVFGLGVLTKPMLVTLPFTLLLLDFWPLNRLDLGQQTNNLLPIKTTPAHPLRLVIEKTPFLVLALAVTVFVSNTTNNVPFSVVPMDLRLANAVSSYWHYLAKMVMPLDLAMYYPYPSGIRFWPTIGIGLWLLCITTVVLRSYKHKPYLAMGWLWFTGTLVPVLGIIQAGFWPASADRWSYVPMLGLFIIIAWGVPELITVWRPRKVVIVLPAIVILAILTATSWHQVRYWANNETLYKHAIEIGSGHHLIYNNLGVELIKKGRTDEAIRYLEAALENFSEYPSAHNNLGTALVKLDRPDEAIWHFRKAISLDPDNSEAGKNLANTVERQNIRAERIRNYLEALKKTPDSLELYNKLGMAHAKSGQIDAALEYLATAIEKDPAYKESYNNLGIILLTHGYLDEAITYFKKAVVIDPEYVEAQRNLSIAQTKPALKKF